MLVFLLRRFLQSILVLLAVTLVAFTLFRYVGDPLSNMVGQDTPLQERARLRHDLGLEDPLLLQFARFALHAARGELGISYQHARPVAQLIAERLPATIELSLAAILIALGIGMPLGVYTGLHREGRLAR